ncbi:MULTISPECIES: hypothetical protein [Bacillus cereus group]|uniref:Uncharacterized protein n=1 Tax=Bacillus mycoides TaxID=1405 RepID=A0A1E8B732_BACMY|nr:MULTISPECIES: hypothetical protein [Bacillus cereus group]OFD78390.1 hypothetical protein BWGOE8_29000 [Bacillus mycoides]OFD78784.1 hypothetical protein BWGOE9_29230 [Bacillus mycoides]OFD80550.1 hypothetical protein BWGOE10_29020 [Bacillus mycoides]
MKQFLTFILTILPAFAGVLGFINPSWSITVKLLLTFILSTVYLLGIIIYLHKKLTKVQKSFTSLNTELTQLKNEKGDSDKSIDKYDNFVHKRKLFIHHDLPELGVLITEFEVHVKDSYRGQKHQELRVLTTNVKSKTIEVINKEKRDFDEQLYNIQGN